MTTPASRAKTRRALQRQSEVIAELTSAGYRKEYAMQKALLWHPTPRQAEMQEAEKTPKRGKKK